MKLSKEVKEWLESIDDLETISLEELKKKIDSNGLSHKTEYFRALVGIVILRDEVDKLIFKVFYSNSTGRVYLTINLRGSLSPILVSSIEDLSIFNKDKNESKKYLEELMRKEGNSQLEVFLTVLKKIPLDNYILIK